MRVVARFRPVNGREEKTKDEDDEYSLLIDEKTKIVGIQYVTQAGSRGLMKREENHNFVFDNVFGPNTTQSQIFEEVAKDAVQWITEGYNSTIFACKFHLLFIFHSESFFFCYCRFPPFSLTTHFKSLPCTYLPWCTHIVHVALVSLLYPSLSPLPPLFTDYRWSDRYRKDFHHVWSRDRQLQEARCDSPFD